jgi:hypothetical protein
MTLATDTDIVSMRELIRDWIPEPPVDLDESESQSGLGYNAPNQTELHCGHPLDSKYGVICRASNIESRVCGIYITGDNVKRLLEALTNPSKNRTPLNTTYSLLERIYKSPLLLENNGVLTSLERKWTGHIRQTDISHVPLCKIYAHIRFSYYITGEWRQVRELNYIATSEDGIDVLSEYSKLKVICLGVTRHAMPVSLESLTKLCDSLWQSSIRQNLTAAMSRQTLSVTVPSLPLGNKRKRSMISGCDSAIELVRDNMDGTLDVIRAISQVLSWKHQEPGHTYLWSSSRQDTLDRSQNRQDKGLVFSKPIAQSDNGMVLVYGNLSPMCNATGPGKNRVLTMLSLWIIDEGGSDCDSAAFQTAIATFIERGDICVTMREYINFFEPDAFFEFGRNRSNRPDLCTPLSARVPARDKNQALPDRCMATFGDLATRWKENLEWRLREGNYPHVDDEISDNEWARRRRERREKGRGKQEVESTSHHAY